jgi:hypothetical protein
MQQGMAHPISDSDLADLWQHWKWLDAPAEPSKSSRDYIPKNPHECTRL